MSGSHLTFNVSSIEVRLAMDSQKKIQSIQLTTKSEQYRKEIQKVLNAGEGHEEQFESPLVINHDDHLIASIKWSSSWKKHNHIAIVVDPRQDVGFMRDDQGIRSYRKMVRKIQVIVVGQQAPLALASGSGDGVPDNTEPSNGELIPTTASLLQRCPRFRLLLIGNSGVGKSSLINKVFGVKDVHVSYTTRGAADIDKEFISPMNKRIVIHDSLGLEAADNENMNAVKDFVSRRQSMPRLEDKLQVIWLCLEIPYADGRLLEDGVERFLANRQSILGGVPVVVVLTKLDLLINKLQREADDEDDANTLEQRKTLFLDQFCTTTIHKAAGGKVPHVAVSTTDGHSESLSELFRVTKESMTDLHVDEAPVVAASSAQRISVKDKIESSIAIGKKRYWSTLMKSAVFQDRTMTECLKVIREDILTVWNLEDPDRCLLDDDFSGALLQTENLGDSTAQSPMDTTSLSQSITALLAALAASGEPTMAIVVPIAGMAIWVVKWGYQKYNSSKEAVKTIMAYIVNLTCIMQIMFILATDRKVTSTMTSQAIGAYEKHRLVVRKEIDAFDTMFSVLPGGRDLALDKIQMLIWLNSLGDHEVEELRRRMASG